MDEVTQLRDQLKGTWSSQLKQTPNATKAADSGYSTKIRKALVLVFAHQSAILVKDQYWTVGTDQPALVVADSHLVNISHKWLVYNRVSYNTKQQLVIVPDIEPE